MDTWDGVGTELSLVCATITNTDVADWVTAAPRRMALFVSAVCKAAGEDVFTSLLEGADLRGQTRRSRRWMALPSRRRKEERRTFRANKKKRPDYFPPKRYFYAFKTPQHQGEKTPFFTRNSIL